MTAEALLRGGKKEIAGGKRAHRVQSRNDGGHDNVVDLNQDSNSKRQWTLKGIPPEAVEQTREAARRNGMKLNSWVTAALYRAVDEGVPSMSSPDSPANEPERHQRDVNERLQDIENYIKEEFDILRRRSQEIEESMRQINAFLIKMYVEK